MFETGRLERNYTTEKARTKVAPELDSAMCTTGARGLSILEERRIIIFQNCNCKMRAYIESVY